ncbi:hypothetical protein [Bacillus phage SRT01hs]|uniref:Uncharacterized protein n=1 Tax=Bacillus phage SRT01hs TaxID=2847044 RepID=A0A6B9SZF8_9CAUD|nr:hypothetical protein H3022_gp07 [Bacillus phage SRT01hs]QHJ75865.1 hypothetical protein [Bacillus phage SRT01hs]
MGYVRLTQSLDYLKDYIENEELSMSVSRVVEQGETVKLVILSPYSTRKYCVELLSSQRFLVYEEDNKYQRKAFYIAKTNKGVLGRINEQIDVYEQKMRRQKKIRDKEYNLRLTEEE